MAYASLTTDITHTYKSLEIERGWTNSPQSETPILSIFKAYVPSGIYEAPIAISICEDGERLKVIILDVREFSEASAITKFRLSAEDIFNTSCRITKIAIKDDKVYIGSNLGSIAVYQLDVAQTVNSGSFKRIHDDSAVYLSENLQFRLLQKLSTAVHNLAITEIQANPEKNTQQWVAAVQEKTVAVWNLDSVNTPHHPHLIVTYAAAITAISLTSEYIAIALDPNENDPTIYIRSYAGEKIYVLSVNMWKITSMKLAPDFSLLAASAPCLSLIKVKTEGDDILHEIQQDVDFQDINDFQWDDENLYISQVNGDIYFVDRTSQVSELKKDKLRTITRKTKTLASFVNFYGQIITARSNGHFKIFKQKK